MTAERSCLVERVDDVAVVQLHANGFAALYLLEQLAHGQPVRVFLVVVGDEVVARVDALQLPSYTAFLMPRLEATYGAGDAVVDVAISYPYDLAAQTLEYAAIGRDDAGR